jgi:prepilin signal peptidase PulO-like enzyme (type II secretory pathway)
MMIGPAPVAVLVIAIVMAISTVTDLRERRVPLWLTAGSITAGLLVAGMMGGATGGPLRMSVIGLVVGVLILLPFVLLGGIGAGDALLLGVVGTWLGWTFVLWTTWWASLAGGALALVALWRKQRTFPYVPALAIGAIGALLLPSGFGGR